MYEPVNIEENVRTAIMRNLKYYTKRAASHTPIVRDIRSSITQTYLDRYRLAKKIANDPTTSAPLAAKYAAVARRYEYLFGKKMGLPNDPFGQMSRRDDFEYSDIGAELGDMPGNVHRLHMDYIPSTKNSELLDEGELSNLFQYSKDNIGRMFKDTPRVARREYLQKLIDNFRYYYSLAYDDTANMERRATAAKYAAVYYKELYRLAHDEEPPVETYYKGLPKVDFSIDATLNVVELDGNGRPTHRPHGGPGGPGRPGGSRQYPGMRRPVSDFDYGFDRSNRRRRYAV